jgi:hypothetical protein
MVKPTYNEEQKRALIAEFEASGLSMNAFVKGEGKPSYPAFKRWYEAAKGGTQTNSSVASGAALNVAAILAESKRQLAEGRKAMEKRRAALIAQIGEIDTEISKVDEALAKLG